MAHYDVYYEEEVTMAPLPTTEETKIKMSSSAMDNLLVGKELVMRCAKANAKTAEDKWDMECLSLLGVATGAAFLFFLLFVCVCVYAVRACRWVAVAVGVVCGWRWRWGSCAGGGGGLVVVVTRYRDEGRL